MRDEELRALLPKEKCDTDLAEQVVALGYPAAEPIVPELLEWLQDMNWPVARVLVPFLAEIGTPLVPEIRRILKTNDEVWKHWILSCLVRSPEMVAALEQELTQ